MAQEGATPTGGDRSPSTTVLLEAACTGDTAARDKLIARYEPRLRSWVRRELGAKRFRNEGDDVLQTVLVSIVQSLSGLRKRTTQAFNVWLNRLIKSRILDLEKAKRRLRRAPANPHQKLLTTILPDIAAKTPTPSRILITKEQRARIERAIAVVPARYQGVLRFILAGSPSPEDVAAYVEKSPEAARKFVTRALRHLQRAVRGRGGSI